MTPEFKALQWTSISACEVSLCSGVGDGVQDRRLFHCSPHPGMVGVVLGH